jgi:hypothetical protein
MFSKTMLGAVIILRKGIKNGKKNKFDDILVELPFFHVRFI